MIERINNYIKRKSDKEYQQLVKLSKFPRYTKGEFIFKNDKYLFPDAASFVFMYKEIFKEEIYRFDSEKEIPFIIDCGANIGMSIIYCKKQFPKAKIIAFEPEKRIFQYLKKNIDLHNLSNVDLINKAVWRENTTLNFINEGADANRITSLYNDANGNETYNVEAVKLSEYIIEEVDFLKLDIEGAEVEVLKEIEPKLYLAKHLFIEYHSSEFAKQQLNIILDILSRNNFHYYIDSPNRAKRKPFIDRTDTNIFSFDFFLNVYAIRND